ncbi:hypothetical protein [Streptomyces sp. NPDC012510]|uniref:hypothetical protein n=1 Tax=Streptomyces sp. NPDC012510 TaxID=3364838 RepID=UPI0036E48BA9
MSVVMDIWRLTRRADRRVAVVVGVSDVLLSLLLFLKAIGMPPFSEAMTREEETADWHFAVPVFGCWLLGGLLLFAVLAMPRTLLTHLAAMLLPPIALMTPLLLAAL